MTRAEEFKWNRARRSIVRKSQKRLQPQRKHWIPRNVDRDRLRRAAEAMEQLRIETPTPEQAYGAAAATEGTLLVGNKTGERMRLVVMQKVTESGGRCTVPEMIAALKSSHLVFTYFVQQKERGYENDSQRQQLRGGLAGIWAKLVLKIKKNIEQSSASEQRRLETVRMFQLMKALETLENDASASEREVTSWEDAIQVLQQVFDIGWQPVEQKGDSSAEATAGRDIQREFNKSGLSSPPVEEMKPAVKVHPVQEAANDEAVLPNELLEEGGGSNEREGGADEQEGAAEVARPVEYNEPTEEMNAAMAQDVLAKLMRPLTDSGQRRVRQALAEIGLAEQIIRQVGTDSVQRKSFQTLAPGVVSYHTDLCFPLLYATDYVWLTLTYCC